MPARQSEIGQSAPGGGINLTQRIIKWIVALSRLCGVISALFILIAVILTCQMIWIRFVLNGSTVWQTEAVIYLMVSATLIGLPYVQFLRGHVRVDLLPILLGPDLGKILSVTTQILSLVIIGVMTWYSWDMWHVAWQGKWTSDTIWGVRLAIPYFALPVGFGVYFLQLLAELIAILTGRHATLVNSSDFEKAH